MKKANNMSIRIYGLLLNFYPKLYLKGYKNLMEQTFRDMLKEDNNFRVWLRVVKELPGSIIHEHLENIGGGTMRIKDNIRLIIAIIISILAGVVGFFLTFALGEGLMEVLNGKIAMLVTFGGISIYNFIVCLFIGKFYPKSIWFAGLLINIIVWSVLIMNLSGPGGFVDLWYGWVVLIVLAFAGSFVGSMLLRKKLKQPGTV